MTRYPFRVLDVFAESSLAGNALAVFETGAALSNELLGGAFLYFRSQELFRIDVHDAQLTVTRGHVPTGLLSDFGGAGRGVRRGLARKVQGGARLSVSGDIDEGAAQRLRNIFGMHPIARLRAPHIDKRQTVSGVHAGVARLDFA